MAGNLRVTQEYVSVGGQQDSTLRATQVYVSVLGPSATGTEHEASATSTITLTQSALPGLFSVTAASSISISSAAVGVKPLQEEVSASNALALTSVAGSNRYNVSASNTIAASVSATLTDRPIRKSASSSLALTQSAIGEGPISATAASTLSMTVEVKHNLIFLDFLSAISLSDEARLADTFVESVAQTLNMGVSATGFSGRVTASSELDLQVITDNSEKLRSASNSLGLTQTAEGIGTKVATSDLTLTQTAIQGFVSLFPENTLNLSQLARITNIFLTSDASTLQLTQTVTTNIKMLDATSPLTLTQTENVIRPWYVNAESEMTSIELVFNLETFEFDEVITGLTQTATATLDGVRSLSHILSFAQVANRVHVRADGDDVGAENTLTLTDEARISIPKSTQVSAINLTQTATANVSKAAKSELDDLGVTADVLIERTITGENTLVLKQSVAYVLEANTTECYYTPFVGENDDPDAPTPPPSTYTAAGATEGFRIQYPASGPVTEEISLRGPNLGNIDRVSPLRINRETRGGTLIVYADPIWPEVETLLLSFSGLTNAETVALLDFMETYIGQDIRLIDWENREWQGVITNPNDPVVQDRGGDCNYTASFEFQGTKV